MERPFDEGGEWEKPLRARNCSGNWMAIKGLQGPAGTLLPDRRPGLAGSVRAGFTRACKLAIKCWPGQFRVGQSRVRPGPSKAEMES